MIKTIIFDFDGVIVESAHIKTEAFRRVFSAWPEHADAMVEYHLRNMGVSRFVKFRHFYENVLHQPYTDAIGDRMSERFSSLVVDEIKKAPFVPGALEFIQQQSMRYDLFIASGTPTEELREIAAAKDISRFFKGIYGTPRTKTEIVNAIFREFGYKSAEAVFIGDAASDQDAARQTNIAFILRVTGENNDLVPTAAHSMQDLTHLAETIEGIAS